METFWGGEEGGDSKSGFTNFLERMDMKFFMGLNKFF